MSRHVGFGIFMAFFYVGLVILFGGPILAFVDGNDGLLVLALIALAFPAGYAAAAAVLLIRGAIKRLFEED